MDVKEMLDSPGTLPRDPGSNRVLVVDDDLTQRMMMARMLKKAGYECGTAMSVSEARYLLTKEEFGLLVTDIRMWSEDGLELVRHVDDEYPDTVSIVVTGWADDNTKDVARRSGACELIEKPFDREILTEAAEAAFDRRSATVALRRHRSG